MTGASELWQTYVEQGIAGSVAIDDGVSEFRPDTLHRPEQRDQLRQLSYRAFVIGCQGLLLGDEPIGKLALACERCMDLLARGQLAPEHVLPLLASSTYTLKRAFDSLANADRSGARTDPKPLEAARYELEAAFPAPGAKPASVASAYAPDVPLSALTRRSGPTGGTGLSELSEPSELSGLPGATGPSQEAGYIDGAGAAEVEVARDMTVAVELGATGVWVPSVPEDMVELFFDEVEERTEGLSLALIDIEQRPHDKELLRSVFRDLHTLKGSSAMVGLEHMNTIAHAAEDLVGQLRDGDRTVDGALIDALLAALDALRDVAALAKMGQPLDLDLSPILDRLRNPHGSPTQAAKSAAAGMAESAAEAVGMASGQTSAAAPAAAPSGREPSALSAGTRQTIRVDFDKLDRLMNLVGELVLGRDGLRSALHSLSSVTDELSSERMLTRRLTNVRRGLMRQSRATSSESAELHDIRARKQALRRLMRDLGDELGRVERVLVDITQDLDYATGRLDSVSDDLRDQVMKLRMVPIGGVFRKHHRTVRDLASSLGKRVHLELAGEDTELDKLLVEALDEPLMHLVRNAVDHGIEKPEDRVAAGKAPDGTIRLSALHRGNQMVVRIEDDGKGIDAQRLREKVRERQLLSEEELEELDDHEILDVIFRPGFSTAKTVSQVSGRGVGMDVVRQSIVTQLKGTIDIESEYNVGTTFTLRLPLTLAIIQVLLARAGGEVFAIPLDNVARTISCPLSSIQLVQDREVMSERGRQLPLIRLTSVLDLGLTPHTEDTILQVVVTDFGSDRFGLVCDHLLGKKEIVIKPLGDLLQNVPCAAGATLLGERCALILDVPAVIRRALQHGLERPPPPTSMGSGSGARTPEPDAPHVLLVDDSDTVRESLRRLLSDAGYRCTTAGDGLEGLSAAMRQQFDLVSTDVMMPRMNGYELTRRLRATDEYRDTPIVMVTTRGERIDRVRGFDAGVDEYITKPHDRQLLLRTVRSLLGARTTAAAAGSASGVQRSENESPEGGGRQP